MYDGQDANMRSYITTMGVVKITMNSFYPGDIVIPKLSADNHYAVANTDMKKAEVLDVQGDKICIKVLEHTFDTYEGKVVKVSAQHFRPSYASEFSVLDEIQKILDDEMPEAEKIFFIRELIKEEKANGTGESECQTCQGIRNRMW